MFEIDLHVKETPHWPWIPQICLNSWARVVDDRIVLDFLPADPGRVCAITNTYCYAWFNALSQEERPIQKLEKVTWLPNINTPRDKQIWYQSCRSSQINPSSWRTGIFGTVRKDRFHWETILNQFLLLLLVFWEKLQVRSELSFQDCQNSKQTWRSGIVSPCVGQREDWSAVYNIISLESKVEQVCKQTLKLRLPKVRGSSALTETRACGITFTPMDSKDKDTNANTNLLLTTVPWVILLFTSKVEAVYQHL